MEDHRETVSFLTTLRSSQRRPTGRLTARLLLATALCGVGYLTAKPQPAQAQFVCIGSIDGAEVGDGIAGASASGNSADAARAGVGFEEDQVGGRADGQITW